MQMLVIVIAERNTEGWSAWFRNSPDNVCVGDSDILAILSLVETYGTADMDAWDMTKLNDRSHDGHLEYLLPGTGSLTTPVELPEDLIDRKSAATQRDHD